MEQQNNTDNASKQAQPNQENTSQQQAQASEQIQAPESVQESANDNLPFDREVYEFYKHEYWDYLQKAQDNAREKIEAEYSDKVYLGHPKFQQRAREVDYKAMQERIYEEERRIKEQMEQAYFGSSIIDLKRRWKEEEALRRDAEMLQQKIKNNKQKKGRSM